MDKYKWLHTVLFVGSILCALYFIFLAISSWRILYDYVDTIESSRFWLALISFIGSVFLAIVGILGCVLHFVQKKNKKKSK